MNALFLRAPFRCFRGLLISAFVALLGLLPGLRAQLFTDTQSVVPPSGADRFGISVAASGELLAVSSPSRQVHVFERTGSSWTLQQSLTANHNEARVAIDGNTLVANGQIFERIGGTWTLRATSRLTDATPAVHGDVVVMGMSYNPEDAFKESADDGSGEIWMRDASGWRLAVATRGMTRDQLGIGVATDGNTVVFGVAWMGGAKVWARNGSNWTYQGTLGMESYGRPAVEGDTIAIASGSSAVTIYTRSGTTWTRTQTISIGASSVSLRGGVLAVAAGERVHTYTRGSAGWIPAQAFAAFRGSGFSMGLDPNGKLCVVGAATATRDGTTEKGAVKVFFVPRPPTPGSGWRDFDIGAVGIAGSSTNTGGTVTVRGSGADIWGAADQFHYRTESLTGDGAIIARVTSTGNTHPWAKVGLMAREDIAPAAKNFMALVTPGDHLGTQVRTGLADATAFQDAGWAGAPIWLMIARSGDLFASYRSNDGDNWTAIGSATVKMPATIHVGLAVSSHDNATLNTGTFSNIELVGLPPPPPNDPPAAPTNLQVGSQTSTTVRLSWTDNSSDETGFEVQRSVGNGGGAFTAVATTAANSSSYVDSGLTPDTEYTYRVRATRSGTFSANSNTFTARTLRDTNPGSGSADIGNVGVAGSTSASGNAVTLNAGGEDIWNQADGFRFYYRQWTGDGSVTARVAALSNTHPWAKAGVMIRESLAPGAANATMLLTAGNACGFQTRPTTGAATDFTAGPWFNAPYWVRITRTGNVFSGFISPDGVNWTLIGSRTLALSSAVYVGLAASSHNTSAQTTASFDNVTLPDGPPPPPPADWTKQLWGSTTGSFTASSTAVSVTTAGGDIWNYVDGGLYVWKKWTGDGEFIAQVDSLTPTHPWAKAGLMFRLSSGATAPNAFVAVTPGAGAVFQAKGAAGEATTMVRQDWNSGPGAWLKLKRIGNDFSAYYSNDGGATWVLLGTRFVFMPAEIQVGFAVSSHSDTASATANFSNLSLSP